MAKYTYPTDKDGNKINFKTNASNVYDTQGRTVQDALDRMVVFDKDTVTNGADIDNSEIDDTINSLDKTWSSNKVNLLLSEKVNYTDLSNGRRFKGSCTTTEMNALTNMAIGDYWYISDKGSYYQYSQNGWVNIGNGDEAINEISNTLTNHINANNPHKVTCDTIGASANNHTHDASKIVSGVLPIKFGGTGASTIASVLTNLGLSNCTIANQYLSENYISIAYNNGIRIDVIHDSQQTSARETSYGRYPYDYRNPKDFIYTPMIFPTLSTSTPNVSYISVINANTTNYELYIYNGASKDINYGFRVLIIGAWK